MRNLYDFDEQLAMASTVMRLAEKVWHRDELADEFSIMYEVSYPQNFIRVLITHISLRDTVGRNSVMFDLDVLGDMFNAVRVRTIEDTVLQAMREARVKNGNGV